MKNKILALCCLCSLLFISGCGTFAFTKSNIETRAKGTSFLVSSKLLRGNPTWRDGFIQASADLKFVADQETVDVTTVMAIINRLPKLQTGDAAIYVQGALIIFTDELNALAVKNPDEVRLAAKGLYEGIDLALGFIVPKALKAPSK